MNSHICVGSKNENYADVAPLTAEIPWRGQTHELRESNALPMPPDRRITGSRFRMFPGQIDLLLPSFESLESELLTNQQRSIAPKGTLNAK